MAERKSIYHGLTSDGHGPDEHGLGALRKDRIGAPIHVCCGALG